MAPHQQQPVNPPRGNPQIVDHQQIQIQEQRHIQQQMERDATCCLCFNIKTGMTILGVL